MLMRKHSPDQRRRVPIKESHLVTHLFAAHLHGPVLDLHHVTVMTPSDVPYFTLLKEPDSLALISARENWMGPLQRSVNIK